MRIPLSPAARWVLANLFLHRSLSINGGISQDLSYNRTRAALGLRGPMTVLLKGLEVNKNLVVDDATFAYANLTDENRDFLLDRIMPLEKVPWQSVTLEGFIECLIDWKRGFETLVPQNAELPNVTELKEIWNVQEKEGD